MSENASEVNCRPCRQNFRVFDLENPRRCPKCGGPTVSAAQLEGYQSATADALRGLHGESVRLMRLTSLSMLLTQVLTYFIWDQIFASFFNDSVTTAATVATVATEVWAYTRSKTWMIIASVAIQIAAILFFFLAAGVLGRFIDGREAALVAGLPLAGALGAWHQFRGYNQLLRLNQKKRA